MQMTDRKNYRPQDPPVFKFRVPTRDESIIQRAIPVLLLAGLVWIGYMKAGAGLLSFVTLVVVLAVGATLVGHWINRYTVEELSFEVDHLYISRSGRQLEVKLSGLKLVNYLPLHGHTLLTLTVMKAGERNQVRFVVPETTTDFEEARRPLLSILANYAPIRKGLSVSTKAIS